MITVLAICDIPGEGKREMWSAQYNERTKTAFIQYGKVPPGRFKSVGTLLLLKTNQCKKQQFSDHNSALDFLQKSIQQKNSEGYRVVLYQHDELPMTYLSNCPFNENGFIRMKTWG